SSYQEGLYHATTSPAVLWLSVYFSPLHDSSGNVIGGMAVVEDITVRKQVEFQVTEQAELLDKARDAIFVLDLDFNVVFWNKGAERLYGWTREEVQGRSFTRLVSPIPKDAQRQVVERGEWNGEIIQTSRDGKEKIVESRMTLVRDNQGGAKSILVINTDVTEKKRLEEQFLRSQRLENIGILAGGMAHDLNNVLQPIMMSLQMLRSKIKDEHGQKLVDILQTGVQRGADLVGQVMSFARGVESERIPLNLGHVVFSIEKILKHTFPKNINIQFDVEKDLWDVLGDSTQLYQVVMNLCVNGRDAMPEGGVLRVSARNVYLDEEFARVNIDAKVGPYVVLSVSDTGAGIEPGIMDKIFIPFFSTKEPTKGTGLGLPTVFGIVRSHGGFIEVESELGRGSVFRVYLPAIERSHGDEVTGSDSPLILGEGELIMIVDDESSILEVSKDALERCGYRVITAKDGVEALAFCRERGGDIKVAVLDLAMSVMDGLATIRELRSLNPDIRIIATSGLRDDDRVAKVAGADVVAFLGKPFTSEKLLMTLAEVLGKGGGVG
ncbi:MAG: PAS domain S-box protein, partial [Candidatus Methanosuratincola sp.]